MTKIITLIILTFVFYSSAFAEELQYKCENLVDFKGWKYLFNHKSRTFYGKCVKIKKNLYAYPDAEGKKLYIEDITDKVKFQSNIFALIPKNTIVLLLYRTVWGNNEVQTTFDFYAIAISYKQKLKLQTKNKSEKGYASGVFNILGADLNDAEGYYAKETYNRKFDEYFEPIN